MNASYITDGRHATRCTQKARRAVVAGRARYLHSRPVAVEVRQPTCPPVRHPKGADRRFGEGILRSLPSYRLDCTISDLAWYEEQLAMEEEREIDRRFREFEAMERLSAGLDA